MDAAPGMAPQPVRGLDGEMLMTGRVNGTKAAPDKNAYQVLIICGAALASPYPHNWDAHQRHRQP
jgi:hypothetical protein